MWFNKSCYFHVSHRKIHFIELTWVENENEPGSSTGPIYRMFTSREMRTVEAGEDYRSELPEGIPYPSRLGAHLEEEISEPRRCRPCTYVYLKKVEGWSSAPPSLSHILTNNGALKLCSHSKPRSYRRGRMISEMTFKAIAIGGCIGLACLCCQWKLKLKIAQNRSSLSSGRQN